MSAHPTAPSPPQGDLGPPGRPRRTLTHHAAGATARVVGGVEVLLGLGLLAGRWQPLVLAGVAAQLAGTFLVLLLRPDVAFIDGNLLTLTAEGEYVVKNLVLLAAALTLAGWLPARRHDEREVASR